MMGLSPFFSDHIQGLRQKEINLSLKFRYIIVLLEVIGKSTVRCGRNLWVFLTSTQGT